MNHQPLIPQEAKAQIKETLRCPYCGRHLKKCLVPDSPFTEWPSEFQYLCFNDECPYFLEGWRQSSAQAFPGSYRFMYDPTLDSCFPVPVLTRTSLRESIVNEKA